MNSKHPPLWVYGGGMMLTMVAGSINVVGLLDVHHRGLTHVTGTVSQTSALMAAGDLAAAASGFFVLLAFFFGAMLSGLIVRDASLHASRRYGVALMVESALLAVATYGLLHGHLWGQLAAAMAAGLQNALATSFSGAVIRTTHMTGILTDLGLNLGHAMRHPRLAEWGRIRLHLFLLTGFFCGGFGAALLFGQFGYYTLLLPVLATGVGGFGYWLVMHRRAQLPGTAQSQFIEPIR